ncbi:hypothetical protein [Brumimicrobium sp.]|uniref:hypothetical protein n=1 Tax=Brumimicrobium sp. TaxID=2029867 RepID=UPI003A930BD4
MKTTFYLLLYFFIFSNILLSQDQPNGNARAWYEIGTEQEIDDNVVNLKPNAVYFQFNTEEKAKNLESLGFGWIEDNPENHFVAYLINTSDSTFSSKLQDGSLLMIQEAMNEKEEWVPIEYWVKSGCGNSYRTLNLKPGQQVMIPIKKYQGSFKTKIRLKLQTGKEVFYSQTFEGAIELTQFNKETESVGGILYRGPANYLDEWP